MIHGCAAAKGVHEGVQPTQHVLLHVNLLHTQQIGSQICVPMSALNCSALCLSVACPTMQCAAQVPFQLQKRMKDSGVRDPAAVCLMLDLVSRNQGLPVTTHTNASLPLPAVWVARFPLHCLQRCLVLAAHNQPFTTGESAL